MAVLLTLLTPLLAVFPTDATPLFAFFATPLPAFFNELPMLPNPNLLLDFFDVFFVVLFPAFFVLFLFFLPVAVLLTLLTPLLALFPKDAAPLFALLANPFPADATPLPAFVSELPMLPNPKPFFFCCPGANSISTISKS